VALTLTMRRRKGKLFGSVTNIQIEKALKAKGSMSPP
jgi:ribosomal protein L9